jgi:UDP-N-acetylmuramate dehydrogenase
MNPVLQIPRSKSVRLSDCTTFRIGGPCREFIDCKTPDELRQTVLELAARNEKFLLIGGGSNLLVSDRGVDSVVVRFANPSAEIRIEDDELVASAAASLDDLARFTVESGIAGSVSCSGIPGTVGGAVVGNAGAFGEQIGDNLISATLLDHRGLERVSSADELGFAYRRSRLQESGAIVVEVRLRASRGDAAALRARRDEILTVRAAKHPDWHVTPTAGSFFKNIEPTSKAERRQAAGWFLEQAGAKDLRVGGARTFEKHANIIIAEPGCTACDVLELSNRMAALVREKFGFDLQREVRLVGDIA